jgi:transposase
MEDMANHYGYVVIPACLRRPKDKGLVENHVKIVYNRVYAQLRNRKFFSLEELNHAGHGRMLDIAFGNA